MDLDSSKINGSRLMFTIAFFLQSSALLTTFITAVNQQDAWFSAILGTIVTVINIFMYAKIATIFPNKNLIQVFKLMYGKVIGSAIGFLYVLFFLTLTALNLNDLGTYAKLTVMYQTPKLVLTGMCMLVAIYAVRHGLRVVSRYSGIFVILEFIIIFITTILVVNQIEIASFEPFFFQDFLSYVQGAHIVSTIPFGETVVFLMIVPNLKIEKKKMFKYWFWGFFMGAITLLIVLIRDIGVLGNTVHMFNIPNLITLRLVNINQTISRLEIIFAVTLMILLFFKISVLFYISVIATCQLFETKGYRNLVFVIGFFILLLSETLYPDAATHIEDATNYTPIVWTIFETIIPLLTLIIYLLKQIPKRKKVEKQNQKIEQKETT